MNDMPSIPKAANLSGEPLAEGDAAPTAKPADQGLPPVRSLEVADASVDVAAFLPVEAPMEAPAPFTITAPAVAERPAAEVVAPVAAVSSAVKPAASAGAFAEAMPSTSGIGILLVNLGTPDAPEPKAVRRYLQEFLADPRVIENKSLLWKMVLNGIILPLRPRRKAKDYKKIWNNEKDESPLKTLTRSQAEKLAGILEPLGKHVIVDWAMRYASPSIASRLEALIGRGCDRILVMPLYPQYAAPTTATVCDEVFRFLMGLRRQPALRIMPAYYDDPYYIEVLASSLKAELKALSFQPDVIVASYHGMPLDYVRKGDPYATQCERTTQLLREQLKLDETKLIMTYQSRFGRGRWLTPYTIKTVKTLAKQGVKNLAVITPGFAADCLETLEEIAGENAHVFKRYGGKNFAAIPCLNDSEAGMLLIWQLAMRELKGWV
jgi:protoporphyrin/coproporphyrin ferrochelatase